MHYTSKKLIGRSLVVAANTFNSMAGPVFSILLSVLVIRMASQELWGAFVGLLVMQGLANHIAGWGNKEFLLRSFSREPGKMASHWQHSLLSRMVLFLPVFFALKLYASDWQVFSLLSCWILIRYLYQSFEVVILYRKAFRQSIAVECSGFVFAAASILLYRHSLSLTLLLEISIAADLLKTVIVLVIFAPELFSRTGPFEKPNVIRTSFIFFLIGFSGMLQSRIDLYCVAIYLPKKELAFYQVLMSFLLYLQAGSYFIIAPYVKNLYRMKEESLKRVLKRLFRTGLVALPLALSALYLILKYVYCFEPDPMLMGLSLLFTLPVFYYSPLVYRHYRHNAQNKVVTITVAGAGANLLLNLLFIPYLGIKGSLLASGIAQVLMAVLYTKMSERRVQYAR